MGECELCHGYRNVDGTHAECQEIHDKRIADGLCFACGDTADENDETCWSCGKFLIPVMKNYPNPNYS